MSSAAHKAAQQPLPYLGELPTQSDSSNWLMPRPGEVAETLEPLGDDEFKEINPAFALMESNELLRWRGTGMFIGISMTITSLIAFMPFPLYAMFDRNTEAGFHQLMFLVVLFLYFLALALVTYFSARNRIPPPVILCRKSRSVWAWTPILKKWVNLDYDKTVGMVVRQRVPNLGGSMTVFRLTLNQVRPGTRQVEMRLAIGTPAAHPNLCAQLWEFVRCYMDSPAEAVPPVRLAPSAASHPKAWMAMVDRTGGFTDKNYRVTGGLFGWVVVVLGGMIGYWSDRAAGWIARNAPRVQYPKELAQAMRWSGPNPYRITSLRDIDQLAVAGQLPHMRLRWRISAVLCTLLYVTWMGALPYASISNFMAKPLCMSDECVKPPEAK